MISENLYSTIFLFSVITFTLLEIVYLLTKKGSLENINQYNYLTFIAFFVILYIGLRPITELMGDTVRYAELYRISNLYYYIDYRDLGFFNLMKFSHFIGLDLTGFFIFSALIYVGCIYIASIISFSKSAIYLFLVNITSLSFWGYGINGIRNGLATSIFFLGITLFFNKKKSIGAFVMLISCFFHSSLMLVFSLFIIAYLLRSKINVKYFFYVWGICLLLSIFTGRFLENLFVNSGLLGDEIDYLIDVSDGREFSVVGFRYDFVLYSSSFVFFAWWVYFKKQFKEDVYYNIVLSVFLAANSFWLLMNQNWLSNRYAYLSWFLYPFILVYPVIKNEKILQKKKKLSLIMFSNILFTFIMWSLNKYR